VQYQQLKRIWIKASPANNLASHSYHDSKWNGHSLISNMHIILLVRYKDEMLMQKTREKHLCVQAPIIELHTSIIQPLGRSRDKDLKA
jgi:hypothetical protein